MSEETPQSAPSEIETTAPAGHSAPAAEAPAAGPMPESTPSVPPSGLRLAPRDSLASWVMWVLAAAWAARLLFLANPYQVMDQETMAVGAAYCVPATDFATTDNWAERWALIERFSLNGKQIFTSLLYLIWGYCFYTDGPMAYVLNALLALAAAGATAGIGHRLFGRGGLLTAALLAGLSPFFLFFSIHATPSMVSAAFMAAGLYALSSPRWTAGWIIGGFCMGCAFSATVDSIPPLMACGAGLVLGHLFHLFRPGPGWIRRFWRFLACPVLGAAAGLPVPYLLEAWAKYSNSSYFDRLFRNDIYDPFMFAVNSAPRGRWLVMLLELEPALTAAIAGSVVAAFALRRGRWGIRIASLGALGAAAAAIYPALGWAPVRFWGWTGGALIVGLAALALRWPCTTAGSDSGSEPETPPPGEDERPGSFNRVALAGSCAAMAALFTRRGEWSLFPHQILIGWPLFLAGAAGLLSIAAAPRLGAALRALSVPGVALLAGALVMNYQTNDVRDRALLYQSRFPGLKSGTWGEIAGGGDVYNRLKEKSLGPFTLIGPNWRLHPILPHVADPMVTARIRDKLKQSGLEDRLRWEDLLHAQIFFEERDPSGIQIPPPGTPMAPEKRRFKSASGSESKPRSHPTRGMEMRLPKTFGPDTLTASSTFTLAGFADGPTSGTFGFEYQSTSPYVPPGAELRLEVFRGEKSIGEFAVPNEPVVKKVRLFKRVLKNVKAEETFRIAATLKVPKAPPGHEDPLFCPAIICYIRRPFLTTYILPRLPQAGFAKIVECDVEDVHYPGFNTYKSFPLHLTRKENGLAGKGIRWLSAPWNGRADTPVAFIGTHQMGPKCRLFVNGTHALDFTPGGVGQIVSANGFTLVEKALPEAWGFNMMYTLTLPGGFAPAGKPLEINVKAIDGVDPRSWWGVRNQPDWLDYWP